MITLNQRRTLRFIATSTVDLSINEVARHCKLSPNGAYKVLKKLEEAGLVRPRSIANIRSYRLIRGGESARRILEYAFLPEILEGRIKARSEDLVSLKDIVKGCIFFGSYTTTKKNPSDIDALMIVEKEAFTAYKEALRSAQEQTPVKIHDVVQTMADLEKNLKNGDPIIIEAVRNGVILWGAGPIIEAILNVTEYPTMP